MDTALFYPNHLELSPQQARIVLRQMVNNVVNLGGVLTINWHDRSLAPERLWDASYREVVQDLKSRGAWFATAGQAVAWFQKRRSVVFEPDSAEPGSVRLKVAFKTGEKIPALRLRAYKPGELSGNGARRPPNYHDSVVVESVGMNVPSGTRS
jgi:hypothetical protein